MKCMTWQGWKLMETSQYCELHYGSSCNKFVERRRRDKSLADFGLTTVDIKQNNNETLQP